ncbi:chemotaxis protein [Roseospira marina]|uniref:Chemotaxis protein n=1 Tax=Roseospira marina TaxID=140057 RepID=A0A5M6IDE6_9PROT|nr:rod-binding protein [Roseospira marina]KAA5605755.1 chemotaxis protein [Roseospira marina]MBB4313559.1 Rod binding domain-containing protein [Roseospira marina]MBB5086721.1 Rod binding domain-containing protein [Roseospira marina]
MDTMIQAQAQNAMTRAQSTAPAGLAGIGAALKAGDMAKARETAQDFEAFFLSQMMQPMFSGLSTEPPFGGGHAENTWRSLLVDEYGKLMARNGGVGIADSVMRTMLAAQEA